MLEPIEELIIYLRLAQAFEGRRLMPDRDRALVMAGTCACALRMQPLADFCRRLILSNNTGHMLRKYEDFGDAITDPDFGIFLKNVRRKIPPKTAENQLVNFDYECDVRQEDYETRMQFAAAVMGVDAGWLQEEFGKTKG